MRGVFSGSVWGLFCGSLILAMVSLMYDAPAASTPPKAPLVTAPVEAPQPDATTQDTAEAPEIADDTAPESTTQTTAPRVSTPEIEEMVVTDAQTAPAQQPTTEVVVDGFSEPADDQSPEIAATTEDPVLPNPQGLSPQMPETESDVIVSTAPAALPEVETPDAPADAESDPAPEPQDVIIIAEADVPEAAPTAPEENETPDATVIEDVTDEDTTEIEESPSDVVVTMPSDETAPEKTAADDEQPSEEQADAPEEQMPVDDAPTTDAETPDVITLIPEGASNLPTGNGSVQINRPNSEAPATQAAQEETVIVVTDPSLPAISRYSMLSQNPENKPMVSVVLIDDGDFAGAIPALAGIPFPVTVMLDPGSADARDKMVAYRAAGIEVGILAELPDGATPSDVEVYFEAAFSMLPETVAVLDGAGTLSSGGSRQTGQVIETIAAEGRGLVTVSRGLNSLAREAGKLDVPNAAVYRDLDSDGQAARVIRRFMDQAAFRARQESGVVLLGRVRADTISALILWGTANRAGQVALVPVSSVLLAE
jgi:hypothetical protein